MRHAAIYHWWNETDIPPYQDLKNPVLISIATMRATNPDIRIYVLDVSERRRELVEWGPFPSLLDFEVVKRPHLFTYDIDHKVLSTRLCSRVWDVECLASEIPEQNVMFCDSDIFWLKNPTPFNNEINGRLKYFFSGSNNGVWHFEPGRDEVQETLNLWKSYIMRAANEASFREEVQELLYWHKGQMIQDEMVFGYLIRKHTEHFHPVSFTENYIINRLVHDSADIISAAKNLHALHYFCGKRRGLVPFLFEEFGDLNLSEEHKTMILNGSKTIPEPFSIYGFTTDKAIEVLEFLGVDWHLDGIFDSFHNKESLKMML